MYVRYMMYNRRQHMQIMCTHTTHFTLYICRGSVFSSCANFIVLLLLAGTRHVTRSLSHSGNLFLPRMLYSSSGTYIHMCSALKIHRNLESVHVLLLHEVFEGLGKLWDACTDTV